MKLLSLWKVFFLLREDLGVICEQRHEVLQYRWYLADVQQEQCWSKNGALGDSAQDCGVIRKFIINSYSLLSVVQEFSDPAMHSSSDALPV